MKKVSALLLAGLAPALAFGALTPEPAVAPVEMFGASVDLKPGLKVAVASDSNIYTEPANREDDSLLYSLSPSLTARVGDDEEYTELALSVTGGFVDFDSADDYTDYSAYYTGRYAPAGNVQLGARVGTSQAHDARGSNDTDKCTNNLPLIGPLTACNAEPSIYQDVIGNLSATLGSSESRGRFTLALDGLGRRYANNGATTDALEYDTTGGSMKFAWEVGGKTDAVVEAKLTEYAYKPAGASADSSELEYMLGVEWDVSGKTTGYAKVGQQEKDFDLATKTDLDNPTWRLGATWLPSEQGMINLELSKAIRESTVLGTTAKNVTNWNFMAMHRINDRVEPFLRLQFEDTDYEGAPRTDESTTYAVGVDYKFRRWIVFGFSFERNAEESSVGLGLQDYEADVVTLSANMTL